MKLRHYLLLQGYVTGAMALTFAILPFFVSVANKQAAYVGAGLSIFCAVMSVRNFKSARNARDEERAFAPPVDAPADEQISFFKRTLILGVIGFVSLSILTAIDLNALESDKEKSVRLVVPVGSLYSRGGYWTAVSFFPLTGMVVCSGLFWKIRKLRNNGASDERS